MGEGRGRGQDDSEEDRDPRDRARRALDSDVKCSLPAPDRQGRTPRSSRSSVSSGGSSAYLAASVLSSVERGASEGWLSFSLPASGVSPPSISGGSNVEVVVEVEVEVEGGLETAGKEGKTAARRTRRKNKADTSFTFPSNVSTDTAPSFPPPRFPALACSHREANQALSEERPERKLVHAAMMEG